MEFSQIKIFRVIRHSRQSSCCHQPVHFLVDGSVVNGSLANTKTKEIFAKEMNTQKNEERM
jgi:hypothetical protein